MFSKKKREDSKVLIKITIPVTAKGVSAAKVVATIDIPDNHQGISLFATKKSEILFLRI